MSPLLRAGLVMLVVALIASGYAISYVVVQSDPRPHHVDVALAGARGPRAAAAQRLRARFDDEYDVRLVRTGADARRAVLDGEVSGALLVRRPPVLLIAPARGASTARALVGGLPKAAGVVGTPQVKTLRPLPPHDEQGTALGLILLPLSVVGVLVVLLLSVLAPELRVRQRALLLVLFSVAVGLASGLSATVGLDVLQAPDLAACAVLAAIVAAVGLATLGVVALVGPIGVFAGFLLFLVVGNVAAGATTDNALMPQPWRAIGPFLPPGAGADLERALAPGDPRGVLRPLLVLGGFAGVGLLLSLLRGDRRPAPKGDPDGPTKDQHVTAPA